jgi:hypothetical protein
MLSSIFALLCPPVGLADQLVDVLAAWIGVDDRRPGLPAVHGMGHEYVELGEVNARVVVGEFGGWVAELSLKLIAAEVDVVERIGVERKVALVGADVGPGAEILEPFDAAQPVAVEEAVAVRHGAL